LSKLSIKYAANVFKMSETRCVCCL